MTSMVSLAEKSGCYADFFSKKDKEYDNNEIHGKIEEVQNEENKKYNIFVKENDDARLQRFVLAHELGHLLLNHSGTPYFIIKRRDLSLWNQDEKESEANLFAVQVLITDEHFKKAYSKTQDITELASIFSVPEKAICMKIDYLDM